MVADKVTVTSKKAGSKEAWTWESDGKSGYEINKSKKSESGTEIILHLNKEGREYANKWKIEEIIKKYSDHIDFPIYLTFDDIEYDKDGKEKVEQKKQIK